MKSLQNFTATLLAIGFFGLLGWGTYLAIRYLMAQFEQLDDTLAAILSLISVLILICTLILAQAIRSAGQSGKVDVPPEKAEIYQHFMRIWFSDEESIHSAGISNSLHARMLLWAGPEVLRQYHLLREISNDEPAKEEEIALRVEKFIQAIRQDLGHSNLSLTREQWTALLSPPATEASPPPAQGVP